MSWAFIDYENIGCLSKLDLSTYEKVIVFAGAKQPKLDFGDKKYEHPINLVLIQIKASQANNLDFHLAYYLGKFDNEAKADVSFDVISNDNGFSPLISHITKSGRKCRQVKLANTDKDFERLIVSLSSKPKDKRPKKVVSLKNHIASHMSIKGNEVAIQNQLNRLVNAKFVTLNDTVVEYKK
ncbi:PIN domain-containing protein [Thalassotalea mangrovi]|uniref:PIN-like domain-containing protein n=1 Tax=Thalassotalea mangrovi TaxID=2572245 RepID=A0A4V5NUE6_9GAMM|nr:PIN domain-containing protein [Thalassotalea mangrovi]TKB46116.1 hypothetical protein E8M12_05670 [Thalassotalea mangrovi]